jgi:hypothetical protein
MSSDQKTETSRTDVAHTASQLRRWWDWRGGWRGLFRSGYFWTSVALLAVTAHYWLVEDWWEMPLSILPNVIGFSLGGYAILLAFGDERFRAVLLRPPTGTDQEPNPPSRYMRVSAIFLHFILVQIWALAFGIVAKATNFSLGLKSATLNEALDVGRILFSGFGFLLFLYAIALAAGAAMSVFGLSEAFEVFIRMSKPRSNGSTQSEQKRASS